MDLDTSELPMLPARDPHGHKGSFGVVAIVGGSATGSQRMIGAPALAARGALRAGAGLVKLVCPEPVLDAAITIEPSATGIALATDQHGMIDAVAGAEVLDGVLASCDVLAIGPGLGKGVEALVLRAVGQEEVPVVVDADALNALAGIAEFPLDFHARAILTPHPGEFDRLARALRITADARDERSRPEAAATLAQRLGCVVVLKGAGSVVSDGLRTWVCRRGHPCLGTAGTGDVLTGLIAAFVGQSVVATSTSSAHQRDLYDAARLGVEIHARAGERWSQTRSVGAGLLARELADELPSVIETHRASSN